VEISYFLGSPELGGFVKACIDLEPGEKEEESSPKEKDPPRASFLKLRSLNR